MPTSVHHTCPSSFHVVHSVTCSRSILDSRSRPTSETTLILILSRVSGAECLPPYDHHPASHSLAMAEPNPFRMSRVDPFAPTNPHSSFSSSRRESGSGVAPTSRPAHQREASDIFDRSNSPYLSPSEAKRRSTQQGGGGGVAPPLAPVDFNGHPLDVSQSNESWSREDSYSDPQIATASAAYAARPEIGRRAPSEAGSYMVRLASFPAFPRLSPSVRLRILTETTPSYALYHPSTLLDMTVVERSFSSSIPFLCPIRPDGQPKVVRLGQERREHQPKGIRLDSAQGRDLQALAGEA
jgi:hypothetical protein